MVFGRSGLAKPGKSVPAAHQDVSASFASLNDLLGGRGDASASQLLAAGGRARDAAAGSGSASADPDSPVVRAASGTTTPRRAAAAALYNTPVSRCSSEASAAAAAVDGSPASVTGGGGAYKVFTVRHGARKEQFKLSRNDSTADLVHTLLSVFSLPAHGDGPPRFSLVDKYGSNVVVSPSSVAHRGTYDLRLPPRSNVSGSPDRASQLPRRDTPARGSESAAEVVTTQQLCLPCTPPPRPVRTQAGLPHPAYASPAFGAADPRTDPHEAVRLASSAAPADPSGPRSSADVPGEAGASEQPVSHRSGGGDGAVPARVSPPALRRRHSRSRDTPPQAEEKAAAKEEGGASGKQAAGRLVGKTSLPDLVPLLHSIAVIGIISAVLLTVLSVYVITDADDNVLDVLLHPPSPDADFPCAWQNEDGDLLVRAVGEDNEIADYPLRTGYNQLNDLHSTKVQVSTSGVVTLVHQDLNPP